MGKPTGFLEIKRETARRRPVATRLQDFLEVYQPFPGESLMQQGARCMDCGIPFCHQGCPLGNLIPDWNDLVYRDQWQMALDRLHATNNFPEFTGKLCPAPCEASCVLGINEDPVAIKQLEAGIIDRAWDEGWVRPQKAKEQTGKRVAIVGSGPAGLACAQQLVRVGHAVTVFERAARPGGLLRYGIPDFKMEKRHLDRRLDQLIAEGVEFRCSVEIGGDLPAARLLEEYDAICLCAGATAPRDLKIEGRELAGIHFAMPYLVAQNQLVAGEAVNGRAISAKDKNVIIIGGGDTGADCLGTVHRQGARSVHQFEIVPRPPDERSESNPWPQWSNIFRVSSAHEEGGERDYSISTVRFLGKDGRVAGVETVQVRIVGENGRVSFVPIPGTERTYPAELVLLALGFSGPERSKMLEEFQVELDAQGNVKSDDRRRTSVPKVFTAGDMARGQSLIVWAIAEGRHAAASIDRYLMGSTDLPEPLAHGAIHRPFV